MIGPVSIRLRVCPLQGVRRDPLHGSTHKVFGSTEADVPIQVALLVAPVEDLRFAETGCLPIEKFIPIGSEVIPTKGKHLGQKGRVVKYRPKVNGKVEEVEVEFDDFPPEAPFGYSIAASIVEEHYSAREVCQALGIEPSVIGRIVGSIMLDDADKHDVGLNFKRNGVYQLLGYARFVAADSIPAVWNTADSVRIVGSDSIEVIKSETEAGGWEYTSRAIALIADYSSRFPKLLENLRRLPYQPKYKPKDLLGDSYLSEVAEITAWMKEMGIEALPRTPLTTSMLCTEAVKAVERAADKFWSLLSTLSPDKVTENIRIDHLICNANVFNPSDAPLNLNKVPPVLGDRIVNLSSIGVPFGLKGTVVGIHSHTGYIDVGGRIFNTLLIFYAGPF